MAFHRQKQLEDILVLAKQFHETTEPVSDWLAVTEKKLANSEPIGTQTAKIQQQISRHKVGAGRRWLEPAPAPAVVSTTTRGVFGTNKDWRRFEKAANPDPLNIKLVSLRLPADLDRKKKKFPFMCFFLIPTQFTHSGVVFVSPPFFSCVHRRIPVLLCVPFISLILHSYFFFLSHFLLSILPSTIQALEEEIESHAADVSQALGVGQSLSSLSCAAEQRLLAEKLEALQSSYGEVQERCGRKAALLAQALANARIFGEEEVEVLNWLAEVEDKLGSVAIKDYKRDVLQKQHADQLVFSVSFYFYFFPSMFCVVCFVAFLSGFVYGSGLGLIFEKLVLLLGLSEVWRGV